jgi:hypothetical protein
MTNALFSGPSLLKRLSRSEIPASDVLKTQNFVVDELEVETWHVPSRSCQLKMGLLVAIMEKGS